MIDEGPSREDLDRFGGDTAYCPECGAEIYDAAEECPSCGVWIRGGTRSQRPLEREMRTRMIIVIVVLTLFAFLIVWALRTSL